MPLAVHVQEHGCSLNIHLLKVEADADVWWRDGPIYLSNKCGLSSKSRQDISELKNLSKSKWIDYT